MKTKLFLICLLYCTVFSYAQKEQEKKQTDTISGKDKNQNQQSKYKDCNNCKPYNLVYDFKCKKFYKVTSDNQLEYLNNLDNLKIKYKEGVRIKIVNLNRYLYETSLSYDDVILKSEEPQIFKNLFLGADFDFKLPISASKAEEHNTKEADTSKAFELVYLKFKKTKKDIFIEKLYEFKQLYNELLENYLDAYSLCKLNAPCCKDMSEEKPSYSELSNCLFELKLAFYDFKTEVTHSKNTIQTQLTKLNDELSNLEQELENAETASAKKLAEKKIANKKKEIEPFETALKDEESEESKIEEFKATLDKLNDEELMKLVHFGNNLVQDNYEYILPTIYPTGDRLTLNLKISPNSSEAAKKWQSMSLDSDEFNLDFRVRNKWFFSFSTGPYVGLSNQFRTDKYGWQKVPDSNGLVGADSKYKIASSGREGMPVGIGGFANFGTRLSDWYGIGASVGAGVTILDDTRLSYFLGITQFFGQDNQFNLTAGISFMQVNELDKGLYPNIGTTQYDTSFDLEYTKKFNSGFFISLSYTVFNPSKNRKGNSSGTTNANSASANTTNTDDSTTTSETETKTTETGDKKENDGENSDNAKKTTTSTKVTQKSGLESVLKTAKKIKIKN